MLYCSDHSITYTSINIHCIPISYISAIYLHIAESAPTHTYTLCDYMYYVYSIYLYAPSSLHKTRRHTTTYTFLTAYWYPMYWLCKFVLGDAPPYGPSMHFDLTSAPNSTWNDPVNPKCDACSVLSPPQLASLGDWRAVESSAAVESQSRRPQSPLFLRAFRAFLAQGCKVRRWVHAAHLQPQLALASGEEMSIATHCYALLARRKKQLEHLASGLEHGRKSRSHAPVINRTHIMYIMVCDGLCLLLTWSSRHGRVQHYVTCRKWMLFKWPSAFAPPTYDATITPMPSSHKRWSAALDAGQWIFNCPEKNVSKSFQVHSNAIPFWGARISKFASIFRRQTSFVWSSPGHCVFRDEPALVRWWPQRLQKAW